MNLPPDLQREIDELLGRGDPRLAALSGPPLESGVPLPGPTVPVPQRRGPPGTPPAWQRILEALGETSIPVSSRSHGAEAIIPGVLAFAGGVGSWLKGQRLARERRSEAASLREREKADKRAEESAKEARNRRERVLGYQFRLTPIAEQSVKQAMDAYQETRRLWSDGQADPEDVEAARENADEATRRAVLSSLSAVQDPDVRRQAFEQAEAVYPGMFSEKDLTAPVRPLFLGPPSRVFSGPVRPRASEARSMAATERTANAQERASRQATVQNTRGLVADYRQDSAIKGYQNVLANLKTAEAARTLQNGVGDVGIIFAYMRALEPENPNVVREGEYTNASKAAGIFERTKSLPKYFFQGDRLTDRGRDSIIRSIRAFLKSRRGAYDSANDQYRRQAEAFEVDPTLFIRESESETTGRGTQSIIGRAVRGPDGKLHLVRAP